MKHDAVSEATQERSELAGAASARGQSFVTPCEAELRSGTPKRSGRSERDQKI
jgi:hypothetical protein